MSIIHTAGIKPLSQVMYLCCIGFLKLFAIDQPMKDFLKLGGAYQIEADLILSILRDQIDFVVVDVYLHVEHIIQWSPCQDQRRKFYYEP